VYKNSRVVEKNKIGKYHGFRSELSDLIGLMPGIQTRQMLKYFALAIKQHCIWMQLDLCTRSIYLNSLSNIFSMFCTL